MAEQNFTTVRLHIQLFTLLDILILGWSTIFLHGKMGLDLALNPMAKIVHNIVYSFSFETV